MVDAGWRAPRPSLKVGQDYGYQQRSPIYLLVAKRAGIDTLMCASMKLARELKGGRRQHRPQWRRRIQAQLPVLL